MTKRNLTILAVVAVLAIAAVPFLYAQPRMHGHGGPGGPGELGPLGHLAHAQAALGLSDQQVDQIKTIFKDAHEQNAAYREQMRGGMDSVLNTLLQDPSNIAGAQALIDQQAQTERVMKMNMLNAASKALSVLSTEQRTKLGTLIQQHREARAERFRR